MKKYLLFIISVINTALTALYIALVPSDIVPTHYGANGTADIYSSKWTLMLVPCILIVFSAIFAIYSFFAKNGTDDNYPRNKKYIDRVIIVIYAFLFVLFWALMISCLSGAEKIGGFIPSLIGAFFGIVIVFMSNSFSKIKPNNSFGIKTNATLKSEKVWKKTHRLGGYLGVIGGAVLTLLGIAGIFAADFSIPLLFVGVAVYVIVGMIIPIAYAEIIYSREKKA